MNSEIKKSENEPIIYDESWFDVVFNSSNKKAHELLMELLHKDNLDRTIFDDESLVGIILELGLEKGNLIEDIIYLDNLLEQKYKSLHEEVSQYTKGYIIDYYLFKGNKEKIKKHLNYFIERPIKTIDELIAIIQKIQFYGHIDLAIELSKKVYKQISESDELMFDPEENFIETIYIDLLNKIYVDLQSGKKINWDNFRKEASKVDYFVQDSQNEDFELLKESFTKKELIINNKDGIPNNTTKIIYFFTRYMHGNNKVPFYYSRKVLVNIYAFLGNLHKKKTKTLKAFFTFNYDNLDDAIGKKLDLFATENDIVGSFILLWGIPYFYEFLLELEIISRKEYDTIIKEVNKLKESMKNVSNNQLWRYSFLDNLGKLKYSKEEYTDFYETIDIIIPLSNEVNKENDDVFDEEECDCGFCGDEYEEHTKCCDDDVCICNDEGNSNLDKNKALLKIKEKNRKKKKVVKQQKKKLRKKKKR